MRVPWTPAALAVYLDALPLRVEPYEGCDDCGSSEIEMATWVDVNSDADMGGEPVDNYHCRTCCDAGADGEFYRWRTVNFPGGWQMERALREAVMARGRLAWVV